MGQNVTVIEKASSNPEIVRFEINRSLTGMGHERYGSVDDVIYDRAVDRLARSLFEAGGVDDVHINSSVITVRLAGGSTGSGLGDVIRNMFRFYGDDPAAGAALEADAADIAAEEAAAADAEAASADDTAVDDTTGEAADVAEAPESAADHAVAAEAVEASADDAPGDAPTPQPGDRDAGDATASADDDTSNLEG